MGGGPGLVYVMEPRTGPRRDGKDTVIGVLTSMALRCSPANRVGSSATSSHTLTPPPPTLSPGELGWAEEQDA